MNKKELERLKLISKGIKDKIGEDFAVTFILGSGYGDLIPENELKDRIKYSDLSGFPDKMVKGHRGEILTKEVKGKRILFFSGRFHYYQGYDAFDVTLPVRISKMIGSKIMVITNAAGGINHNFKPGDIMIIKDHINLMKNPLIGNSTEGYDLFIDMSEPYSLRLRRIAMSIVKNIGYRGKFKEGVYVATTGPSYETKAEIEFFKRIGADAVGMSTVPEVIVARQEELEIFAISVITNMAAGISKVPLKHSEVLETMNDTKVVLYSFITQFLNKVVDIL